MRLLVLDGNSIANRSFYGIKLLTTRDGRYTNALVGFLNTLLNLEKEVMPDEVAVTFDRPEPTFRHSSYDGYKATRHGMPEELAAQMPVLEELLKELGYRTVSCAGWEADDVLGTLAAACSARGDDCFLATGDRDSLQLVGPHVTVLLTATVMGKSTVRRMDEEAVREQYGVTPLQLIEVKSLMGDASDNIPGVKGIGEKTALALVQRFGSMEAVYEHLDDAAIKPKQRENLLACRAEAQLSHMLGTIRSDAPVPTQRGAYVRGEGDPAAALSLMSELEMFRLIDRLSLEERAVRSTPAGEAGGAPAEEIVPQPLPAELSGTWLLACAEEGGGKKASAAAAEGSGWYAVQGRCVCPLEEAQLLRLLDAPGVRLEVFDSAPLYALALANGGEGSAVAWDAKLAAYLLDAGASSYTAAGLAASYQAPQDFSCAQGQQELYETIEFPLARVLADMSHTGVLVDREGIAAFGEEVARETKAAEERVYEKTGIRFNINSPKQLGEVLFEKMGLRHGKKTKTGWATDAATLEALKDEAPVIGDILEYRTYQKLRSTYVEGLLKAIGPDGRIHSRFNQTEARTGRLSSDEPNLQNIPIRTELGSRLRAFFVAAPGCVLVDADYSQIELRILAHVSGDTHMQEAFRSGADIHRATAARIYRIPEVLVTPQERSGAKAVNFGIMYGKGAFSLSKDLGISFGRAKEFLETYLAAFPSVDGYMKQVIEEARGKGYTTTLFGRRRALPELRSANVQIRASGERMARNTPIQGTAADVIKLAMVRVWERLRREKRKSRLILTVHDELILESPEDEAGAASRLLLEEMEGCTQYAVPLTAECKTGKNWLEAH